MKTENKMIAIKKGFKIPLTRQHASDYSRGMETGDIYAFHRFFTVDLYFLSKYFIVPKRSEFSY